MSHQLVNYLLILIGVVLLFFGGAWSYRQNSPTKYALGIIAIILGTSTFLLGVVSFI